MHHECYRVTAFITETMTIRPSTTPWPHGSCTVDVGVPAGTLAPLTGAGAEYGPGAPLCADIMSGVPPQHSPVACGDDFKGDRGVSMK